MAESKEKSFNDEDARVAYVKEETSSNAKHSTYVVAPKKDPRDGDLTIEYRGEPS